MVIYKSSCVIVYREIREYVSADIYLMFSVFLFLSTGLIFVAKSFQSEDKENRLRGVFLLIAFITFTIGAFLDIVTELTASTLVLARTFQIISAICFYIGFTMPNFVKKLFIKQ